MPAALCHPGCPQSNASWTALDQAWRSTITGSGSQNDYYYNAAEHPMGGASSVAQASWYRFEGEAGVRMPSEAPGTRSPTTP